MAAVVGPAAALFALGGSAQAGGHRADADSVAEEAATCCELQVSAAGSPAPSWAASSVQITGVADESAAASRASRWRVVPKDTLKVLTADVASERGLQVKTILVARTISAIFPEITSIGGVRPDALRWHPQGLALDVMIPNPSSSAGIALGNQIVAFVLHNAKKFDLQDAIWRGTYYTPSGPSGSGYGHYDHVHITTHGGGYPTGREIYIR
jgi:hypothetical protein